MEFSSKLLEQAVEEISQLPGIGKRTALRLALHLLKLPTENTSRLTKALEQLKEKVKLCASCYNISDAPICYICSNPKRDKSTICVVEDIRDVMAIENTGQFRGLYHVLGGKISPIEGVGPQDLYIEALMDRIKQGEIKELIFALSSTMEGDTTNFYIYRKVQDFDLKVSTIARGISVGDELEYADEVTLGRSIMDRVLFERTLKKD
ncbi:MAG: recombination mediator RecR [Flavobacteriaceae bacterium]|nr:recombination mediator RecR [Flavobacteriaceae bacterium]